MNHAFYPELLISKEIKVMGILNVTPDSFSDGGKYFDKEKAIEHALKMLEDGVDIIDIGGESSRPLASPVLIEEELRRTIPVIESVLKFQNSAVISIDTVKTEVADEAMKAGATIINDISGFRDPKMLDITLKHNAVLVIMHMKGTPLTMQNDPSYDDVVTEVYDFLSSRIMDATSKGIDKIIIDPGIGFGKQMHHNFHLLENLNMFTKLGIPILIGLSKKSFIGHYLDIPVDKREIASVILETISISKGARIIRTHNVKNAIEIKKINNLINNPDIH